MPVGSGWYLVGFLALHGSPILTNTFQHVLTGAQKVKTHFAFLLSFHASFYSQGMCFRFFLINLLNT